ncbi:acetyltransferase (GNAT) family protein [Kribbella rubisoli]|uniref:Acetyltransferase (GNAT) family protein n=1 Tax=Kribbella rubisoli TaxID=3075929 RepID=A0A4Q7X7S0_9ACTN|nr:GNAT family N-acetyltransferase [Kribbella rubisoli]RZU19008.1 acetyltransferase (GNAT) family protein [Kribbella rubisoli]
MIIRRVCEGDIESLYRQRLCAFTAEETAELVRAAVEEERGSESCFFVAVDRGDVVGMTTVRRLGHRLCRHRAELGGFVIVPGARGTGLARRIVGAARAEAYGWGCSVLELDCRGGTDAEAAYLGLGFREWGRMPGGFHDRDGAIYDDVRLWMPTGDEVAE